MTPNTNTAVATKPTDLAKKFLFDPALLNQIKIACSRTMTPERVARIALSAALGSLKLQECFTTQHGKASIARELLKATQRGLEVDGRQGHLVPFFSKVPGTSEKAMQAVFVPGYQGLVDLAYNHPNVAAIWADVVYERDQFEVTKGLNRNLVHVPYEGDEDPGAIVAAYAVCEMKSGAKVFEVLKAREINRIRAFSRGSADDSSPWNTNTAAMWKKSAIRALCKGIPQSSELREALSDDDEASRALAAGPMGPTFDVTATVSHEPEPAPAQVAHPDNTNPELGPVPPPEPTRRRATRAAQPPEPTAPPPAPAPAPASVADAGAPPRDYIDELMEIVINECKSNFDTLRTGLVNQGMLHESVICDQFSDIPKDLAKRLVDNRRSTIAIIKSTF